MMRVFSLAVLLMTMTGVVVTGRFSHVSYFLLLLGGSDPLFPLAKQHDLAKPHKICLQSLSEGLCGALTGRSCSQRCVRTHGVGVRRCHADEGSRGRARMVRQNGLVLKYAAPELLADPKSSAQRWIRTSVRLGRWAAGSSDPPRSQR